MALHAHGCIVTAVGLIPIVGLLYFYAGWSAFVGIAVLAVFIPLQVHHRNTGCGY